MRKKWIVPVGLGLLQGGAVFGSRWFGEDTSLFWLSIGSLCFLTAVIPMVAAVNGVRAHRAQVQRDAQIALLATLTKIVERTGVQSQTMGLHAYLVRRMLSRWPPWKKEQVRVGRVRIAGSPPASTIVWTLGKGAVGRCWEKRDEVILYRRADKHGSLLSCSEGEWRTVRGEVRMGLSYSEWQTAKRYAGIVVVPMSVQRRPMDRYEYKGCVSLDFLEDKDFIKVIEEHRQFIETVLLDAAKAIQSTFLGDS